MNVEQIKDWFVRMWQDHLPQLYQQGLLVNSTMVQAAMYQYLSGPAFPDVNIWLSPKVVFPPYQQADYLKWKSFHAKKKLLSSEIDLLLTVKNEVKAVLKLDFKASGYGFPREDMDWFKQFYVLKGEGDLLIRINPHTGKLNPKDSFHVAEDVLMIYAVVNQQHSFSLDWETLKKNNSDPIFWYHFLLLKGKIGQQNIKFSVIEGKNG